MKFETLVIHGGIDGDEATGAVSVPIYQTSTYKQESLGVHKGYEYSRTGNPTREALEKLIADLEEGDYGFAFASGLAAITAVLSTFKAGDKIAISNNVYGGTYRLVDKIFSKFNIIYETVDTSNLDEVEEVLKDDIKAIIVETPTNPLMHVADIEEIAKIAHKNEILVIVDNTFMTPYLQKPLTLGADIVVHSATKYLGGHSDLIAGLVVVNSKELAENIKFVQNSTGGILNPFDAWLLIRGIKTLSVRMDRHNENSTKIVEFLKAREEVEYMYYPGLKEHPGFEIHKKQAKGPGGLITFLLNKEYDILKFFKGLEFITLGESLGGVESLVCHPVTMSHASVPKELREKLGITDNLIRLSVGIENVDDLIKDLENAFEESKKVSKERINN